jgi:segregation and condensation protein A
MSAWLVPLRSRLLLPADAATGQEAALEADGLGTRLVALDNIKALAGWLERRPQLGHDVFARGTPEIFGISVEAGEAVDVIEFVWASLALFDEREQPTTERLYRPLPFEPYPVAEARERILRRLAEIPDGAPLERFLPELPEISEGAVWTNVRLRSG